MGKSHDEETLNRAIDASGLREIVEQKELDYPVGEDGENLSGGQLQRIEIARAFLSGCQVILADEITASLDPAMSQYTSNQLLHSDKMAIEIAHKVTPE
ncbi:MAG: ATP-binding cassette domain-containing protein [Aerococcus sp.]|nr:ATP-binding cassette domain-containing protein [Aerococcus sp.]